jgi:hypothetical protein
MKCCNSWISKDQWYWKHLQKTTRKY